MKHNHPKQIHLYDGNSVCYNYSMKVFLSPAKKMVAGKPGLRNPMFLNECVEIAQTLRSKSSKDLAKLLEISAPLAELNTKRYQDFTKNTLIKDGEAALFTYAGDVYHHWHPDQFNQNDIDFIDDHFLIISALYGLLKPMDKILPYRLEMKNKFYYNDQLISKYWHNRLKDFMSKINEPIILLCSNEYQKALNLTGHDVTLIKFQEVRNGAIKTIALNAKRARGQMAAYITKNKIQTVEDLKGFNEMGYQWSKAHSAQNTLTFIKD